MMDACRAFVHRVLALFRRTALERDLNDELASHLELAADENRRRGMTADEARRQALIQLGGVQQATEKHRDARGLPVLEILAQDLRYGARTLGREPAFAALAILIIALGIGANTTVFSVVNTILLRPLPFPDSDRLVWFTSGRDSIAKGRLVGGLSGVTYTVDAFEEFQRHNASFVSVTAYDPFFGDAEFTMTGTREPQSVAAVRVAQNFFQTLGVQPELGRLFTQNECRKGGPGAVVLSHAFWLRHFNGDPHVVGTAIRLGENPTTIVGVLPAAFDFGSVFAPGVKLDVYIPASMDLLRNWGNTLAILGRLKPGLTVELAQREADVVFPELKAAHKDWFGDYTSTLSGLKDFVTGHLRRALVVLWSAVGMIMLIACVNLSNLLLARSAARSKEFAMRTALGATRRRLVCQLLIESLELSCAGAVVGVALAFALTSVLVASRVDCSAPPEQRSR